MAVGRFWGVPFFLLYQNLLLIITSEMLLLLSSEIVVVVVLFCFVAGGGRKVLKIFTSTCLVQGGCNQLAAMIMIRYDQ